MMLWKNRLLFLKLWLKHPSQIQGYICSMIFPHFFFTRKQNFNGFWDWVVYPLWRQKNPLKIVFLLYIHLTFVRRCSSTSLSDQKSLVWVFCRCKWSHKYNLVSKLSYFHIFWSSCLTNKQSVSHQHALTIFQKITFFKFSWLVAGCDRHVNL